MPVSVRQLFARRLLGRVAEAYGRMLLLSGLFQADCHPGNILVSEDGKLGAQELLHLHCIVAWLSPIVTSSNGSLTTLLAVLAVQHIK